MLNRRLPAESARLSSGAGVSIVVPVLNEADTVREFLQRLRAGAPESEIIVVDGGSEDATVALCQDLADRLIHAPRGRASQMNAGARAAGGAVLWFVHADTQALPPDAPGEIARAFAGIRGSWAVASGCGCRAGNRFTGSAIRWATWESIFLVLRSGITGSFAGARFFSRQVAIRRCR